MVIEKTGRERYIYNHIYIYIYVCVCVYIYIHLNRVGGFSLCDVFNHRNEMMIPSDEFSTFRGMNGSITRDLLRTDKIHSRQIIEPDP